MTRLAALLATGRVSNLPTVASHLLTGACLATATLPALGWPLAATLLLACLFYLGGCFLGDARDAAFDRSLRPERPIPRGILSARGVATAASLMLLTAWLAAPLILPATLYHQLNLRPADIPTALSDGTLLRLPFIHQILTSTLLLLAIASYALLHKSKPAAGLVLMGACRALLVIWAASMATTDERPALTLNGDFLTPAVLAAAATTAAFTIGFVLVARTESKPDQPVPTALVRAILVILPLAGFLAAHQSLTPTTQQSSLYAAAIVAYLAWIAFAFRALPRAKPTFVARCLAAFCLLDAVFLSLVHPVATAAAIAAFAAALTLQKFSPAT